MGTKARTQLLTKNLVKTGNILDEPELKLGGLPVIHPELLAIVLNAANVCVWPQQYVLQLGLFQVDLLNCLLLSHVSSLFAV